MNTILSENNMNCIVNPMKNWGNSPYAILKLKERYVLPPDRIYQISESCFWWVGEDGFADFVFHSPPETWKKLSEGHYQTTQGEGYGGRTFVFNVKGYGRVDVRGAWSGGSYCANQYLPEPTIEVTIQDGRNYFIAAHITWRALTPLLPEGWSIIDSRWSNKHWPELVYNGQQKKDWSEETMEYLDNIYQKERQ